MIGLLPPLGVRGSFTLQVPFVIGQDFIYTCSAHRTLQQMIESKLDPLQTVYLANGLTEQDYLIALKGDVVIVTLSSINRPSINVPSSHILGYDNGSYVPHQVLVVTAMLGVFPVSYDATRIKEAVETSLQEFVGVEVEPVIVTLATEQAITQAEADAAELARQAAMTYTSTTLKDKDEVLVELERLRIENAKLISLLEQYQLNEGS